MVDIGASTLDICIFNINPNAYRSKTSLFTASVKLLGLKQLTGLKKLIQNLINLFLKMISKKKFKKHLMMR